MFKLRLHKKSYSDQRIINIKKLIFDDDVVVLKTYLIKGFNVEHIITKDRGETLLLYAVSSNSLHCTKELLDHGADVNAKTYEGWTALMIASARGYNQLVNLLIKKGANIDELNPNGYTALMLAIQNGQMDIAKMLQNKK